MQAGKIDIAILGGGLAGGLIALALARLRPELTVVVVEQGRRFGGNHVWSCFDSDLPKRDRWLTGQLEAGRWSGYDVHFPGHSRQLGSAYASLTGEKLDAALRAALPPERLLTQTEVTRARARSVMLADGRRILADAVIDTRGSAGLAHMAGGWQKFGGQLLRLAAPHGLDRPVLMDARVEQADGFRFIYCLPFSETEVFIEDTYYSDTPDLDPPTMWARIGEYAAAQRWQIVLVRREETGVLPVIGKGNFDAFWREGGNGARAGMRAALVHPLTSYSLPDAVRFALRIARLRDLSASALALESEGYARDHWRRGRFYRMLARMLFAAPPERRYRVLERFYRLPQPLIERFYAGETTRADARRVLIGRPPVPLLAALAGMAGLRPLAPLTLPPVEPLLLEAAA